MPSTLLDLFCSTSGESGIIDAMAASPSTLAQAEKLEPHEVRVLIVDNEPPMPKPWPRARRVGYDCSVATSGNEGARLIEQERSTW